MHDLAHVAWIVTVVLVIAYVPAILCPGRYMRGLRGFPRSTVPAWILTGINVVWAAWLVWEMPLGRFDAFKLWLYLAAPVTFVLIVRFMDELLAVRALGGLLILVPAPILDAARWHPSPWRLVLTILAYSLVVKGILLLLSPYWFRKATERWLVSAARCRTMGAAGVGLAVVLAGLALCVY